MMKNKKNNKDERKIDMGRIVFLSGDINEEKAKEVIENLVRLQNENPIEDIVLLIDSYGGYVDSMFAVTDMMNLLVCDVRTICIGKAMSAAAFIFISGTRGKRSMTKKSRLLFHQVSGFSYGTTKDVEIDIEEHKRLQEMMIKETAEKSKLTVKDVRKMIDRDTFVIPSKAIEMGLCDSIANKI